MMAVQFFIGQFVPNPNHQLAGAVAVLILLVFYLIGTRYAHGMSLVWVLLAGTALSAAAVVGLLTWAPYCARQMVVNYEVIRQASTPETVFGTRDVPVSPGESIMVRAYDASQMDESNLNCNWHFMGDGVIDNRMGCIVVIRSGTDQAEDNLVVDVQEAGCPWRTTDGLFLVPNE